MWRNIFRATPPEPSPPSGWEARQAAVIAAPAGARLLVDGGPGTGKTAIACARVARLIRGERMAPAAIWLVSFTRTAIGEIRSRIADAIGDPDLAHLVRVSTLDSLAWAINPDAEADEGYDDNIATLLDQIKAGADLADPLGTIGHLFIDEAHDIVGLRADLVAAMLDRLGPEAGITVFADEAQAIYGFADRAPGWGRETLIERLRRRPDFRHLRLETVFRSRDPRLMRLFTETRHRVLDDSADPGRKLTAIRRQITRLADGRAVSPDLAGRDDILVLFRSRAEVLAASARLHESGTAHRLRLSDHPAGLAPWIAGCLGGDDGAATLTESGFAARWDQRIAGTALATLPVEAAWAALLRLAGDGGRRIEMAQLTRRLAGERPPMEVSLAEAGSTGPILGTIHASKGREADEVHLMLPIDRRGDCGEEARIVYVGATRARRRLLIGTAIAEPAERMESGRIIRREQDAARIEFGRGEDLDAECLAGRRLFADPAEVEAAQHRLRALAGRLTALDARRRPGAYHLAEAGGMVVAALGRPARDDLAAIARLVSATAGKGPLGPPERIAGLWLIGLRSVAHGPDERLHRPYAAGGFLLCPIIVGYARVEFHSLAHRPGSTE